ncbi:hypothetical protein EG329_010921 [Mollisiaceae sp. DMI_Dod_QoI]|nr:hypothetical protein EG329_010921 [Helotiales sp. DMI_Dod_QoI]
MIGTQDSSALPLPPDFMSIEGITNMASDMIKAGTPVNVIGFIKDYQPPVQTRGSDYKCTLAIIDHSTQSATYGLKVNIFWPLPSMPVVTGAKDIALLRKVKIQMFRGSVSLLANKASEFHILSSKKIPTSLTKAPEAPWTSYQYETGKQGGKVPDIIESRYAIWANSRVNEMELPSDHEFEEKTKQAMTVRDKFCLLKDVKPDNFYNILGQVIRVYESGGRLTLYLSDYTANSKFYNYVWGEDTDATSQDGDEYGYTKTKKKEAKSWPGPFGKLTIQLTLFDGHADFVLEEVKVDDWVLLSNVQIKYAKMGGLLEGFLRGDQHGFKGKFQVKVMEQAEDPDENDARWKEGIRRKYDWWKKFKAQRQDILDDAAGLGSKRKNGEESVNYNSKKRRKERRALAAKRASEAEVNLAQSLDLNENIRCTFPDQPITSVKDIIKPQILLREDKTEESTSPFTLCKYKAHVRVVDYFPHRIEDFAVGRKPSEMDMLSDYSGGEDTDLEETLRTFRSGKGFSKVWQWRFALQVEDASSKDSKDRLWLMVDNHAAQFLLSLEDDATNLRGNQTLLTNLKEQLFKLWGDLEERKSSTLLKQSAKQQKPPPPSSFQSTASSPPRKTGGQPDLDSDDEDSKFSSSKKSTSIILKERDVNVPTKINGTMSGLKADANLAPKNKAFTCCIKQYGIKVEEDDPAKANAGRGQRWQRMFGLFGTQIM